MDESISTAKSVTQIMRDFLSWPRRHEMHNEPINSGAYVLGIAGCSNSGKTTLSKTLSTTLIKEGMRVAVLPQDAFYYPMEQLERVVSRSNPEIIFYNYDTINALDMQKFVLNVQKAITENDFVIAEGNMIMEISSLRQLLHRCIFITLNYSLCEQRRTAREYNPMDLPGYLEEIVWPTYRNHLANAFSLAHHLSTIVFVDGNIQGFSSEFEVKMMLSKLSTNLLLIQADELQLSYALEFVNKPKSGGISIFLGTTRDNFGDKVVDRLEFEAYDEMVYKELDRLCYELRKSYPTIDRIALFHRVGKVFVGEASVIMAVSAPHRQDTFRATEKGIDYLKNRIPIWKKEVYSDDTYCWKRNS
ncbi:Zinc finger, C2H2 type family protein [Brugia malayi]|uniref:Zinc finger, C2H2 type family protein n=1 Tax=Brugia malayi TaxID=6279 RepID=A0A4E9FJD7_BRUMA|nr:Zinc finger, C2H2 type family protein [Brugia malayi]VIO95588.1 Zinc finger, C2H2 type family protein [Brugia malayi]